MKLIALPLLLVPALVMGCSKEIQRVTAPRSAVPDEAPLAPATAGPKPAAHPGDIYYIDEYGEVERGGGGGYLHAPWWGGPQTVPFGDGVRPEFMLTVARRLTMVRWAVTQMESRGFVRRADLDGALNADTTGTVIIAFEQPGSDPVARQPCIIIHSGAVDGGAITQATGAVYVMNPDSTLSIDDSALSPFVVTGVSPTHARNPGRLATPARMLDVRDIMGVLIDNAESPNPYTTYQIVMAGTDPCVWKAYFDFSRVALIEAGGYAALGAMTTKSWWGGCVGFVAGALFAEKDWYLKYADGFPCGP